MNIDMNTIRLLGAAQVVFFVGFLVTGGFFAAAVGSGSISDSLVNISIKPAGCGSAIWLLYWLPFSTVPNFLKEYL